MIVIDDKILSDDIIEEQFLCNLKACKGACCWEGDFGAPLNDEELPILAQIYDKVEPFLSEEGKAVIKRDGFYSFYKEEEEHGTPLLKNGACAYMTYNELGIAQCGIEQAYNKGLIDFKKPISCHLYPIRITEHPTVDMLNYDKWDICSAACTKGKKEQVPLYKFLKEPLIRKYGEEFYERLELLVEHFKK